MDITYDSLLDEDPEIQERVAKAKIAGQQKAVLDFMEVRFPSLIQVAQEQVIRLNKPDELSRLMKQIALAPDESPAGFLARSQPDLTRTTNKEGNAISRVPFFVCYYSASPYYAACCKTS